MEATLEPTARAHALDEPAREVAHAVAAPRPYTNPYLAGIGLDYIFSNPDILQNPPYNRQFDEWSKLIAQFGKKDLLEYAP